MKYKPSTSQSMIILLIVFSVMILLKILFPGKDSNLFNFTLRVGATSSNGSNKWHYKFYYLDGSVEGWLTAENDHAQLICSSNIEEGAILYRLYGRRDSLLYSFPAGHAVDTLRGIFAKGEKYEIRATATRAKGNFDFRME